MHIHAPASSPRSARPIRSSMLRRSAFERLGIVAAPLAALWLLVTATLVWWP